MVSGKARLSRQNDTDQVLSISVPIQILLIRFDSLLIPDQFTASRRLFYEVLSLMISLRASCSNILLPSKIDDTREFRFS